MIALGLHGWPGRGHDAAACLVMDGSIIAAAEEERFIRKKHAYGAAPRFAAAFCLAQGGLTLDDVDVVAFGWDIPRLHRARGLTWEVNSQDALELLLPRSLFPRSHEPTFEFIDHHLAHAASAFYLSGDLAAAVLVMDGQGEDASSTIFRGQEGKLTALEAVPVSWSLGYFYDAVGQYCGLGPDQAGKLMGLAAYGKAIDLTMGAFDWSMDTFAVAGVNPLLRSAVQMDEDDEVVAMWLEHLSGWAPLPPNLAVMKYQPVTGRCRGDALRDPFEYRDLAATAQAIVEAAAHRLAERAFALTGETTLHLAGGVALNASMNGSLLDLPAASRVFVQPIAGDAGVAIGAALTVAVEQGDAVRPMTSSIAWGWEATADNVRNELEASGLRYSEPADISSAVARLLEQDKLVGWFQGRGEVGPRALGHRSILALPQRREIRDRINLQVKRREWWRPLAPSMSANDFSAAIDAPGPLPYMVATRPLRDHARERFEAVAHVDGTTRPQSVEPADEPVYHRLLERVAERCGYAVVLNTSLNGSDEPIAWTPADAIRTYASIGLDALAIGPYLTTKD